MRTASFPHAQVIVDGLKLCAACKEVLPVDQFYADKQTKTGLRSYCGPCDTARVLARRERQVAKDPEAWRRERRRARYSSLYGLSEEQLDEMLLDAVCAICGEAPERICIDHDHSTGKVRGVLCDPCNVGLGRFKDDPERLVAAAAYLLTQKEGG